MAIDFAADLEECPPVITDAQMAMIANLAKRQIEIEQYIAKCESNMEIAKANLRKIQEVELPSAMKEIGMSEFKLSDGTKVTVKNEVYCSIPKDGENRVKAFSWLRENDLDGVIKNTVAVQFGKGEDAGAMQVFTLLSEEGFQVEQTMNVHPQTLKALIKEQLSRGVNVPLDAFGAFTVDKSKVEVPK